MAGHHLCIPDVVVEDVFLDERREAVVPFVDDARAAHAGVDRLAHVVWCTAEARDRAHECCRIAGRLKEAGYDMGCVNTEQTCPFVQGRRRLLQVPHARALEPPPLDIHGVSLAVRRDQIRRLTVCPAGHTPGPYVRIRRGRVCILDPGRLGDGPTAACCQLLARDPRVQTQLS